MEVVPRAPRKIKVNRSRWVDGKKDLLLKMRLFIRHYLNSVSMFVLDLGRAPYLNVSPHKYESANSTNLESKERCCTMSIRMGKKLQKLIVAIYAMLVASESRPSSRTLSPFARGECRPLLLHISIIFLSKSNADNSTFNGTLDVAVVKLLLMCQELEARLKDDYCDGGRARKVIASMYTILIVLKSGSEARDLLPHLQEGCFGYSNLRIHADSAALISYSYGWVN
ncbi:hypothetical protein HAX54_032581 [Datura stramonium]|uniref:Uncharacterized protein n=1 Tax=Datura stramonium TaxID=4076 RepID=A0ABS8VAY5_DATST|nr:hypothetical protein [Datura stramonium]